MGAKHAPADVRLWRSVDRGDGGCWLWRLSVDSSGYGQISIDGRLVHVHRFSHQLAHGPIPPGRFVLHRCEGRYAPGDFTYRRCVNPDHLYLGDAVDNAADMVATGRVATGDRSSSRARIDRRPRGEKHPTARLTEDDVRAIRAAYRGENLGPRRAPGSMRSLALKYGVGKNAIQGIIEGKTWRHVG